MGRLSNNIFLIAGEKSGDLYGGELIEKMLKVDSKLQINFWGGNCMHKAGGNLLQHYKHYNFMGLDEVLLNLVTLKKKLNLCKSHILTYKPKVIILIDFPGFNLRMAKFSKNRGIKVIYFIPPKVWAWNNKRIFQLKKYVDYTFSILPFEVEYYKKYDVKIFYFGNPLVSIIKKYNFIEIKNDFKYDNIISLLPGSRFSEISYSISVFKKIINSMPKSLFYVGTVSNISNSVYSPIESFPNVRFFVDRTYDVVRASKVSVVVSGTATLEVALLNVPQIVVYKTSFISYLFAKMVLRIKYISLVNLILNKLVVKEFIQGNFNHLLVAKEMNKILNNKAYVNQIKNGYKKIKNLLGNENVISKITEHIINVI